MLPTTVLTVLLLFLVSSAQGNVIMADSITLVDFSDSTPALAMQTVDDPVMGGKSSSSCHNVAGESLVWEGTVRIVDFLKAPGFCNLRSTGNPDLSVLKTTRGIAFHVKSSASSFFHPMGINLQNGLRTSRGIPITYSAQAKELEENGVTTLYASWPDFRASAYGQPVNDAPPLNPEGLSRANQFGLSTYEAHQEGTFHMEILSVVGLVSTEHQTEEDTT